MNRFEHFIVGGTTISSIQLLDTIPTDPNTWMAIGKLIVQIAIGVVTLYKMIFPKKTNP